MDPVPPDSKRPRLSSWPAGAPQQGVSLPHPHHQHPQSNQLPPPPPPPGSLHHPGSNPYPHQHQHYPPRSVEHASAPPTPAPASAPPPHPEADRRHHEQEPYAHMQDHYRQQQQPPPQQQQQQPPPQHQHPHQPPPSPAHPSYQPYPSRDPPIKRDPAEDQRRPNSTGHAPGPEGLPSTPHLAHPPPPPPPGAYSESQPRHMSYENAPSMPPTPGGYRAPSYPPPTPVSHQPSYEQHGGYSSSHDSSFYNVYTSSQPKKKNTRASQEKGVECKYRDPVPKATDKAQADILDGLTAVQSTLGSIMNHLGRFDQRLVKMESLLPKNSSPLQLKHEPAAEEEYKRPPPSPYITNGNSGGEPYYPNEQPRDHPSSDHMPLRMMAEDEMEVEPGPPVPPGEPAIPINHTTLAGLLLDWPSIRELTKHLLEREGIRFISEYPISQEQNRGVLIVYGRGEDSHPSRHVREPTDHGTLDMADDSSDMASPSPAADWGQLGGLSPPDQVEYKGGVLAVDGNPDFSEQKVWQYVESFKEHILNMHPIIQPKFLDDWVRHFLDSLPASHPRSSKPQTSKPAFAVGGGSQTPETTGAKRKRSPGPDGSEPATPAPPRAGRPDRSIHSALVLTVLALGKICLYRENVPDVVHSSDPMPHGSPITRNGGVPPSPTQGSPPAFSSHSHSSGLPSPKEQERGIHSRRSSIHGMGGVRGYSLKKNYEVIPGLEYFAYATDILGNHTGAYNNMKNVYVNIFAGLYHGQLGRPMESFAFIHKASHKLQVIMRPSLDKLRRIKRNSEFIQETKYNQLALTFWTCLQLESDLIAELQLPPSGLLSYEDDMPHPNMSLLEGYNQRILDSYPGQLYLRTHLNSIHRMFYAPEDPSKIKKDQFRNVSVVSDAVSGMHWVAPSFAFREDDLPADDILAARLRAKYWGAQVITYRPFVRQILQFSHSVKNHPSSPNFPTVTSEFRQDVIAPVIHPKTRTHGDIDPKVVELAKKGIKALIESTRAFHGLGAERPIITNVFGTAHAQWGNLLVLSAAFKDPVLHTYGNELSKNRHAYPRRPPERPLPEPRPKGKLELLEWQHQCAGIPHPKACANGCAAAGASLN
ncbi:hypothetical protein G7Z17_g5342 [Cylindrodendrum hubeiense]|uniref:Uncharacterized protein n=1 Tax=Cylindrodendrum hubeiense TaxID=595255 RepID=A0A9P5H788_9HYPO|nr:hypothetical protein G7Z17_g5342 [Cylindrodendrum hubeiense]